MDKKNIEALAKEAADSYAEILHLKRSLTDMTQRRRREDLNYDPVSTEEEARYELASALLRSIDDKVEEVATSAATNFQTISDAGLIWSCSADENIKQVAHERATVASDEIEVYWEFLTKMAELYLREEDGG